MLVKLSLRDANLELCFQRAILCNQFLSPVQAWHAFSHENSSVDLNRIGLLKSSFEFFRYSFPLFLGLSVSLQLNTNFWLQKVSKNRALPLNLKFLLRFLESYTFDCSTDCFKTKLVKLKIIFFGPNTQSLFYSFVSWYLPDSYVFFCS